MVNILEGAMFGKKAVGRSGLRYLKQVDGNRAADSYRAMGRVACGSCGWKGADRLKD